MKYNIISIPDIHWGAIDPYEQLKSLEFIFETIKTCFDKNIPIDLVVINGDYFDSKLPLNSREALFAIQWFHELYALCQSCGVRKIRMVQGTLDHDNDQLDAFKQLETDDLFFKIFSETSIEETLPNLTCVYCPDETIETSEYETVYLNELLQIKDIGFFHGSFDVVFGELLSSKPEILSRKNVIYRYDVWNKTTHGPLIAGHWHDGKQYNDLYYVGSPFRYKFNEDEDKGIGFIIYDTLEKSYNYQKIKNPFASEYVTIDIYSNLYNTKEDYSVIVNKINETISSLDISYLNNKVRIRIYLVDEKPENDVFISSLRQNFINHKNVKIVIKNKLKDKIKKESVKKNLEIQKKFDFIYDKSKNTAQIIFDFISKTNEDVEIPLSYIESKVNKYVSKGCN